MKLQIVSVLRVVAIVAASALSSQSAFAGVSVSIEGAGVQASSVSNIITETFDSDHLSTGYYTTINSNIGTYQAAPNSLIQAADQYGGAANTQFLAFGAQTESAGTVTLTLKGPADYFGLWWSAIDGENKLLAQRHPCPGQRNRRPIGLLRQSERTSWTQHGGDLRLRQLQRNGRNDVRHHRLPELGLDRLRVGQPQRSNRARTLGPPDGRCRDTYRPGLGPSPCSQRLTSGRRIIVSTLTPPRTVPMPHRIGSLRAAPDDEVLSGFRS
jgi:hypothetical protein